HFNVAPAGCFTGTAMEADFESSAVRRSLMVSGHKTYALFMNAHESYRNNATMGVPTGNAAQGIYELADGTHAGGACCWDFGNAGTDNCNGTTMNTIFFGIGFWSTSSGNGPWFIGDFEGGVWSTGSRANMQGVPFDNNPNLASSNFTYAFGILKTS